HRVREIAISRDGNVIATANADQTVSLWQRSTQSELHILRHKQYVGALTFSPDGQELMTGEFEGGLVQWNVKEGKEIERWTLPVLEPMRAETRIVRIEYLPNGEDVASVSLAQLLDGNRIVCDILNRKSGKIRLQEAIRPNPTGSEVRDVSAAAHLVAYADVDRDLVLWQPFAGRDHLRRFHGLAGTTAAFSPDGRY